MARCVRCGGKIAALRLSDTCGPCAKDRNNPTANPLWKPGADAPDALARTLEPLLLDGGSTDVWGPLRRRAEEDPPFARGVAEIVRRELAAFSPVDQASALARMPAPIRALLAPAPPIDPEELALLDAIAAEPDRDEPRLVYADWLLEQRTDEERARGERIHAEVQLAASPDDAGLLSALEALHRSRAGRLWKRRTKGSHTSDRGMPLVPEAEHWLVDPIDDPWLRGAIVCEGQSELWRAGKLAASPNLARFIALDLSRLEPTDAAGILRSPNLGKLAYLKVGGAQALPRKLPYLVTLVLVGADTRLDVEMPKLRRKVILEA